MNLIFKNAHQFQADSKNSPLALLAQTCSSIGKEKTNKGSKHQSSLNNNLDNCLNSSNAKVKESNDDSTFNTNLNYYTNLYGKDQDDCYYKHKNQYLNSIEHSNTMSKYSQSPSKNSQNINKTGILTNGNNNHKRIPSKSFGDNVNKSSYRCYHNANSDKSNSYQHNNLYNNVTNGSINNNNNGTCASSSSSSSFNSLPNLNSSEAPFSHASSFSNIYQPYNDYYLNDLQQQFLHKLQQEFLMHSNGLFDPYYLLNSQQQYLFQLHLMQYFKQNYDSSCAEIYSNLAKKDDAEKKIDTNNGKNNFPLIFKKPKDVYIRNDKEGDLKNDGADDSVTNQNTNETVKPGKSTHSTTDAESHACNWCKPGEKTCGKKFSEYSQLFEHLKEHVNEYDINKQSSYFHFYNLLLGNAMAISNPLSFSNNLLAQQMFLHLTSSYRSSSDVQVKTSEQPQSYLNQAISSTPSLNFPSTSFGLFSRYHPYKPPHKPIGQKTTFFEGNKADTASKVPKSTLKTEESFSFGTNSLSLKLSKNVSTPSSNNS